MKKCDYNVNRTGRHHVTTTITDIESKNCASGTAAYEANKHVLNFEVDD
jgi:hypothetical protein